MPRLRSPHRHATANKRSADKQNNGAGLRSYIPFAKDVLGYYSSGLARVNSILFKWFGRDRYPEHSHGRHRSCSKFPCHLLLSLEKEPHRRHGPKRSAASNALVLMPCSNVKHAAILQGRHHSLQSNRSGRHRVQRKMLKNSINESKSRSQRITSHIESEPLCCSSNVSMDELNHDALSNGHNSTSSSSEEDWRKIRCLTNTRKRFKSCCDNDTSKNRKEAHSGQRNQTCVMCSDSAGSKLIMKTDSPANLIVWPVGSHTQRYSVGSSSQEADRCLCTTLALPHYTEDGVAYYKRGPCKCGSSKKKYASKMLLDDYTVDIDQPPEKDIQNNEIKVVKSKNSLPHLEKNISTLVDSQNTQNIVGTSPAKHEEKRYSSKLNPLKPDIESNKEFDNISKEFPKSEPVAPKLDVELTFASKADIKNNSKILPGNNDDVSVGKGNDTPIESLTIEQPDSKKKPLSISMDDDFIPISSNGVRKYSNIKKKSVCMLNDADYFTDSNRQLPTSTQLCDGSCLPNESGTEDTKITKSVKYYRDSACGADWNQTSSSLNSHNKKENMIEPNPSLRCDVVIDEVNKNTASIHCSELKVEMERASVASNLKTANLKSASVEAANSQILLDNIVNGITHVANIESHEPPITLNDVETNPVPDNSKYTRNITIGFKDKRTFKENVDSTFLKNTKMFDSCEGCDLRIQKTARRVRPSISKETNKIAIDTHVSSSKTAQAVITPNLLQRVKSNCKISTKQDEWIQELGTAKRVYPYSNYPTSETGSNSSSLIDSYIRCIKQAMKNIKNDGNNSPERGVDNMPDSNLKNSLKYGIQTKQNSSLFNNRKRFKNTKPVLNATSQDVIIISPKPRYNCAEMIPASSSPIVKILPGGFQHVVFSDLNWFQMIMEHFDNSSNLESISTKRDMVKTYEDKQDLITEEEPSGIISMKHRKNHELGLIHLRMLSVSAETSSSMVTLSPVFSSCNETEPSVQKFNNDQSQNQARPKPVKLACDCVPFLSSNAYIHQPWCNSHLLSCVNSNNSPTILQTYKPKPLQDPQYHSLFNFDSVDELQSPSGVGPSSSTSGQSYFEHVIPTNYKYASKAKLHLFFEHALSIEPPLQKRCCVLLKPYISHHLVVIDYTTNHQSDSNANTQHHFKSLTAKPVRSILVTNKPTKGPNKQKMICFEVSPRPSLIIETFTVPPFSFCRPLFKQYCQKTPYKIDSLQNNTSIIRMIRKITRRHLYVIHPVRRYKCIRSILPKPIAIINMFIVWSYSYCEEHLTALHQSCEHMQESIQIVINIPTALEHPVFILPTSAVQEVHLLGRMTCSLKPRRRQTAKIEQLPYAVKIYNWSWSRKTFRHFALDMKVQKPDRIVTSYVLHTSFRIEVHMLCVQTCTFKIMKRKENSSKFLRYIVMVFLPKPLFICRILYPSKKSRARETFVIRPLLPKTSHLPRTYLNFSVFIQRWKKFVTASQMKLRTLDRRNSSEANSHVGFVESAAAARLLPSHPYHVDGLTVSSNTSSYLDGSSVNIDDMKSFDKNRPAQIIQSEICVETQTSGSMYTGIYKGNHKLVVDRNPAPKNIEVFIQPIIQRFIFMYPLARAELHMKPNQRSIELPTNNNPCSYVLHSKSKKSNRCKYGITNDYRRINTDISTFNGHKSISNVLIAANQTGWLHINGKNVYLINNNHQDDNFSSNGSQISEESFLKIVPTDTNKEANLSENNLFETLLNTIIPKVKSTQISSHSDGSFTDIYIKSIVATSLHKPSSKNKNFSTGYKSKEYRSPSPEEQKESHNYINPGLIQSHMHDRKLFEKDFSTTFEASLHPNVIQSEKHDRQLIEKDIPTTYKGIDFLNGKFYTLKVFSGENGETVVLYDNNTPGISTVFQSCQPGKDQHSSTFVDPTENGDIKGIHRIDYTSNRSHEFKDSSTTTGILCYEPSVTPARFKKSSTASNIPSYETPAVKNNYSDIRFKRKSTCNSSMATSGNASKCCISTNTLDSSDISSISPDLSELKHHEFMDTPDNMVRLNRPVFSPDKSQLTHILKPFNPQHQTKVLNQSTSTTRMLANSQCQTSISKISYLSSSTFGNLPITRNSGCVDEMLWKESIGKKYPSEAGILKAPQPKVNPMRHRNCYSSPHATFNTRKKPVRLKAFPSLPISRRQAAGIKNKTSPGKSSFVRESMSPCLFQNASHHTSASNRKNCSTLTSPPIFYFAPSEDTSPSCHQPSRFLLICNNRFLPKYQTLRKFQISAPNVGPAEGRRVPKLSRFKKYQGSLTKCQQRQPMFDIPFCQTKTSVCSKSSQDEDPPSPKCLPEPSRQCFKPCQLQFPVCNKASARRAPLPPSRFDFIPCKRPPPVCGQPTEPLIIKKSERVPPRCVTPPPMYNFVPCQTRPPTCNKPSELLIIKKNKCLPAKGFLPPPMFNFKPCQVPPPVCSKPTKLLLLKKRECPPPKALPPAPMFNFAPCQARMPISKPQSKLLLLKKRECTLPKGHQTTPMFDFKPCQSRSFVCNKPSALFLIKRNEYTQPKVLPPPSMFDFTPCQSRPPVFNKPSKSDRLPPRNLPLPTTFDFKPCNICSPISPEPSELLLIKNSSCSPSRCNPQPSVCTQTSQLIGSVEEIKRTNGNNISSLDYTGPASLNPHYIRHSKLVLMKPYLQGISAQNQRQHRKRSHAKNIRPPVSQRARLKALMQKSFEVACKDRQIISNYQKISHYPTCSSLARIIPSTDGIEQLYQREGKLDITNFNNRMTPSMKSSGTIEAFKILSGPPKWSGICASQVEQPGTIILSDTNQRFNFIPKNLRAKREVSRDSSNRNLSKSNFVRPGNKSSFEPLLLDSQNGNLLLGRTPLSPIKGSSPSESSSSAVDCQRTGHVKEYHRISSDETEVSLVDLQAQNELKKDDSSQCSCSDCDTFPSQIKPYERSHSSIYPKGYLKTQSSTRQPNRRQWQINPPILKRPYVTKSTTPNSKANWRHRQLTSRILQKYVYTNGLTQWLSLPVYPCPAPKLSTPLLNRKPNFRPSFSSCYNVSSQLMSIIKPKINAGNSTQSSDANIQLERKLSLVMVPYDSKYDLYI